MSKEMATGNVGATDKQCDVCGRSGSCSLVSSGIAPVTYCLCSVCETRGAESLGVISYWLASYGGPASAPGFQRELVTFINDGYVGWENICAYYEENEVPILTSFREEFGLEGNDEAVLVDDDDCVLRDDDDG